MGMKKGTQKIPTQTELRQSQRRSGKNGGFGRNQSLKASQLFDRLLKPLVKP